MGIMEKVPVKFLQGTFFCLQADIRNLRRGLT